MGCFVMGKNILLVVLLLASGTVLGNSRSSLTAGPANGWLIIQGGGALTNEVKERFVALAGGPDANFVIIPTALPDSEIDVNQIQRLFAREFGIKNLTVLHTRNRVQANSSGFIEPLRRASGVWIDGGRQWRLVDAYLDTAVEREIKAVLNRGGVVGGGSAGATIQGSFLVRGAPGTPANPDGDNRIMMAPGYETGFGLLTNSAIDQHIVTRGRENDLHSVISTHPGLLGIGIDESAAIVVRGGSFFVVGGQVAIHDGRTHNGANYYFLSSGQAFSLTKRSIDTTDRFDTGATYPLSLGVKTAARYQTQSGFRTIGEALLQSRDNSNPTGEHIKFDCDVSLYSIGKNMYPARRDGSNRLKIRAREVNSDKRREFTCKY
jgi:cyanophycinase